MDVKNLDIAYKFKNIELLNTAFTHLSYSNEHGVDSYERMEYLGDSILQLIVSEYLYENFSHITSGELSKYRSYLVSTQSLSTITKKLHFDKYIKIGKALNSVSDALMADLFESVLCAIYLDCGIDSAKSFVMNYLIKDRENVLNIINSSKDYKTALQEYIQSLTPQPSMEYVVVSTEMKNNKTFFTMQLNIAGKCIATVTKTSKKDCEKNLSKIALENLTK